MANPSHRESQEWRIEEIRVASRSPWQNCYVERVIGSIRRECLNHVIVLNDNHLRRLLKDYFRYYQESRTHLSLNKDAPESRAIQSNKSDRIIPVPQVGVCGGAISIDAAATLLAVVQGRERSRICS